MLTVQPIYMILEIDTKFKSKDKVRILAWHEARRNAPETEEFFGITYTCKYVDVY